MFPPIFGLVQSSEIEPIFCCSILTHFDSRFNETFLYIAEKQHIAIPLANGSWDVINGRDKAEHFIYSFIKNFVD
jgi:hypothetical protein